MGRMTMEWARLSPDEMLVATAEQAWVEPAGAGESGVMLGAGSIATTRKLLDGAVGAAFAAADRVPVRRSRPRAGPSGWRACTTSPTPRRRS